MNKLFVTLTIAILLSSSTCTQSNDDQVMPCDLNYTWSLDNDITGWPTFGTFERTVKSLYRIDQYVNTQGENIHYAFLISVLGGSPQVMIFNCLGDKVGETDLDKIDVMIKSIDNTINKNKTVYERY